MPKTQIERKDRQEDRNRQIFKWAYIQVNRRADTDTHTFKQTEKNKSNREEQEQERRLTSKQNLQDQDRNEEINQTDIMIWIF